MKFTVDAGHYPNTAGKRPPDDSMREYHFNSRVVEILKAMLLGYEGVEILTTASDTRDVPLSERWGDALQWKADVFISVHANAYGSSWNDANGIETFVTTDKDKASVTLAAEIQNQMIRETGRKNRGVKEADFAVIWGSQAYRNEVPARVLVECGFMTNKEELALLKTEAYRQKCAIAVLNACVKVYGLKKGMPAVQGRGTYSVDGGAAKPALIINDSLYIPLRDVTDSLGGTIVSYDSKAKHAVIKRR